MDDRTIAAIIVFSLPILMGIGVILYDRFGSKIFGK